jgi:hypothetical protein
MAYTKRIVGTLDPVPDISLAGVTRSRAALKGRTSSEMVAEMAVGAGSLSRSAGYRGGPRQLGQVATADRARRSLLRVGAVDSTDVTLHNRIGLGRERLVVA